jgi:hypothetical protein
VSTVTIAANERAFNDLVKVASKALEAIPPFSGTGTFGPFSVGYQVGFKITGGSIELTNSGRVHIKELDLTYDPLILTFGLDLPHIHIGGECLIPTPFGCALRLPEIDVFGGNPDISVPIDIGNTVVSEFSGEFTVDTHKQVLAAKGALTDHQAHFTADTSNEIRNRFRSVIAGAMPLLPSGTVNSIADALVPFVKGNLADKWQFFLHDVWHNLDLIDIADTAANILRNLVDFIIDKILAPVPSILRGIVKAILHPLIDLIRDILDIPDDIIEWLSSLLGTSLGLFDLVAQLIVNFIGSMVPVYQFETPYPFLDDSSGLIPVLVPVEKVNVTVNDDELVLAADIL